MGLHLRIRSGWVALSNQSLAVGLKGTWSPRQLAHPPKIERHAFESQSHDRMDSAGETDALAQNQWPRNISCTQERRTVSGANGGAQRTGFASHILRDYGLLSPRECHVH